MLKISEQYQMFDCSIKELDALITEQRERKQTATGLATSMLSDIQEMMEIGFEIETVRRSLNRVKYILNTWETV